MSKIHTATTSSMPNHWMDVLLGCVSMLFLSIGIYMAFYVAPLLRHSGLPWWSQKIFYIHLPSAWGSLSGLLLVLVSSIAYLSTRKEKWDVYAVSSAEICFIYGTLVLITGPLWAKPSWNTYWSWDDPRLMSFFALWLILGAYFLLRNTGPIGNQLRVATASLGIIGALSVPFVYLSVKFGRSFHPKPSELEVGTWVRTTVHTCNFGFFFLFLLLMRIRLRIEMQQNQIKKLKIAIQTFQSHSNHKQR